MQNRISKKMYNLRSEKNECLTFILAKGRLYTLCTPLIFNQSSCKLHLNYRGEYKSNR